MGEIIFDSFISSPQFFLPERRQSSQDKPPRLAHQAIPPEQFPCVWQAIVPQHRRDIHCNLSFLHNYSASKLEKIIYACRYKLLEQQL